MADEIKGLSVRSFGGTPRAATGIADEAIDCRGYNAVHVDVIVQGSTSATLLIQGCPDAGGIYQTLPDSQATQTITANTNFDVAVGANFVKPNVSAISSGAVLVTVTPFVQGGTTQVNVTNTAAQNVAQVGGEDITAQDVDTGGTTRYTLPVALMLPGTTPAATPGDATNGLDVDVTRVIPGTGATNAGKAIDSVAGTTDTGVAALAVRDDALGALTPIEGDYVLLRTDANGALWTHDDALDAALSGSELQVDVVGALPAGSAIVGKVGIDQTTPGTTNAVVPQSVATAAAADRTAVAAADVVAAPGTVTCTKEAGGAAAAATYTVFAVAGNTYGRTTSTQGNTTVTTETTNLTIRAAFAAVTGATFYDIYCSADGAASKFVGRITETQRGTGIKITAQNTTGAGGTAGAVDIEVAGTGLAVNAGHLATNTAYTPEDLTPVDPGNREYADVNVTVARSGDSVAASVVLIPFYLGGSDQCYAGDPVPLAFGGVASAYESLKQTLRLPVRGRQFVIVVASIAGTGTTVTTEVVTS